mgnify:CR=1 FL=1
MATIPEYEALRSAVWRQSKHAQMVVIHIEKDVSWEGGWLKLPPLGMKDPLWEGVLPNYRKHFRHMPEPHDAIASLAWKLIQPMPHQKILPVFCSTYEQLYQRYCVDIPNKEPERHLAFLRKEFRENMRVRRVEISREEQAKKRTVIDRSSFRPGVVYIVQAEGTPRIKIGYTVSPEVRLETLNTASPYPLRLLRTIKSHNALGLEQFLHQRYRAYRQHGEWFELPQNALEALLREFFANLS